MSGIVKFTYSIKERLNITKRETIQDNKKLKNTPHYKLFKYLKVNRSIEDNQLATSLEKIRQKSRIVDFTLKYLKER